MGSILQVQPKAPRQQSKRSPAFPTFSQAELFSAMASLGPRDWPCSGSVLAAPAPQPPFPSTMAGSHSFLFLFSQQAAASGEANSRCTAFNAAQPLDSLWLSQSEHPCAFPQRTGRELSTCVCSQNRELSLSQECNKRHDVHGPYWSVHTGPACPLVTQWVVCTF